MLVDRLVLGEIGSSVFESMVMAPSIELAANGVDAGVIVTVPIGQVLRKGVSRTVNDMIARSRKSLPGRFSIVYTFPDAWRCGWLQKLQLRQLIQRRVRSGKYILHCRGWRAAAVALDVRKLARKGFTIINDARGLGWAESAYDAYPTFRQLGEPMPSPLSEQEEFEAKVARESDCVISVSHKMSEYFTKYVGIEAAKVVLQNNTATPIDDETYTQLRRSAREELGIRDELLYVYSGSVYSRQRTAELLQIMKVVLSESSAARWLILTTNLARMKESLDKEGLLDHVFLKSVPFEATSRYLCGSDIGLISTGLFEGPHLANQVCCPVKFAEYVAARCAIVMANDIGDYSDLVKKEDLGVVLQADDTIASAAQQIRDFASRFGQSRKVFSAKLVTIGKKSFSSQSYTNDLMRLYERL